jgi:hypothetical protein
LICCMRSWIAFQSLAIGSAICVFLPSDVTAPCLPVFCSASDPYLASTSLMLPFLARSFELNFVKSLGRGKMKRSMLAMLGILAINQPG